MLVIPTVMPITCASVRVAFVMLLTCLTVASSAGADWKRIDSPNFVVVGDVGARRLRDIAVQFEGFRETLGRVLGQRATATAVPTVVVVFPTERAFTPFKPRYNGRPVDAISGVFLGGGDMNYIAVVADGHAERLRTVFHEYAHLVIANVTHTVPAWLNEGLAEYYSTYQVGRGGREAVLGSPIEWHLLELKSTRLLPLDELLQVDPSSPLYNEGGDRRSVFYAQSWVLTHMLLMGRQNRAPQLVAYLDALSAGAPPAKAWQDAFGGADLRGELETYIRQRSFIVRQYTFSEGLAAFDAAALPLPTADAQAILAELLIQLDRLDEASARLEAGAKLDPENVRVKTVAALLDLVREDRASARRRLRAIDTASDWLVAYVAATCMARAIEDASDGSEGTELAPARRLFDLVLRERPDLPNALAGRVRLELMANADPPAAVRVDIERARQLAPGRYDYALLHAHLLARWSQFSAARSVLGPLLAPTITPDVRDAARQLMTHVVELERSTPSGRTRTSSLVPSTPRTELRPVYRDVKPGEQRLEGVLERIDCARNGAAVFHLRTADGPVRATARLDSVEIISYRDDLKGHVPCGPLEDPLPVYVSWRAAEPLAEKIAVAIEFLPKQPGK